MTTATKTTIIISDYTGNLFCGLTEAQMAGLSTSATIAAYHRAVETALPQYAIEWDSKNSEGPSERVYVDGERVENGIVFDEVISAMSDIFNDGHFWSFDHA